MSVREHDLERRVRQAVDAYHDAFRTRDVEEMVGAFAPDGQVTAAPGTFRGRDEVRSIIRWAVDGSPVGVARDTGGTLVQGHTAVWEGEFSEQYDGIDCTYPIVEVYEFDEELKIVRKRDYYDKLGILHQIAADLPGPQGVIYRFLLQRVIDAGEKGLPRPGARGR